MRRGVAVKEVKEETKTIRTKMKQTLKGSPIVWSPIISAQEAPQTSKIVIQMILQMVLMYLKLVI